MPQCTFPCQLFQQCAGHSIVDRYQERWTRNFVANPMKCYNVQVGGALPNDLWAETASVFVSLTQEELGGVTRSEGEGLVHGGEGF